MRSTWIAVSECHPHAADLQHATRTRLQIGVIGLPHGLRWKVWIELRDLLLLLAQSVDAETHHVAGFLILLSRVGISPVNGVKGKISINTVPT